MKDDIPSILKAEVLYSAPKLEWEWCHLGSSHGHGQMRGYMQQTLGEGIAVRHYSENFGVAVSIMMLQKLPHSEGAKNEFNGARLWSDGCAVKPMHSPLSSPLRDYLSE